MFGRISFFAVLLLIFAQQACQAQPEAVKFTPTTKVDLSEYPWMHPELNMLQFYNREALETLRQKWKRTDKEKLTVIHFGDSHCQNDALPGQIRKRMQEVHGATGRGLMFPTSTARTYSSIEYKTKHTGKWIAERSFRMRLKLPLGIRGMSCRTEQANSSLVFEFKKPVPKNYRQLKIFCKRDIRSFDIVVETSGKRIPVIVDASSRKPYIEVELPAITDQKLTLHIVRRNKYESEFEFYGMSLEDEADKGAVVHNAGVGAAKYNSLLNQILLWEQLPHLQPDVAIIDFGTNDYLYYDKIEPELESEIKTIIDKMRKAVPDICIILTSTQDLFWKKKNCMSGEPFSDMMHKIAYDKKCALFDWYWISGGQRKMLDWTKSRLAQPDMVHLTVKGYRLKGDLFFEALQNSLAWLDENPKENEFFFRIDKLKEEQAVLRNGGKPKSESMSQKTTKSNQKPAAATGKYRTHIVKSGESLYSISLKYNVSIQELKRWNNKSKNTIYKGDRLKIYK